MEKSLQYKLVDTGSAGLAAGEIKSTATAVTNGAVPITISNAMVGGKTFTLTFSIQAETGQLDVGSVADKAVVVTVEAAAAGGGA